MDKDNDGITDVTEIGPNPLNPRDTDGDGTPDYLDNDSDGDGCYDAIEGAGNVLASQVASGGITGTVDNDGIPSLVNGGQGTGVSLEAGKIDITTQPQDLSESV